MTPKEALIELFVLANSSDNYLRTQGKSQQHACQLFRAILKGLVNPPDRKVETE